MRCLAFRKVVPDCHPGSTNEQIREACDAGPMGLQSAGLAYWTRNSEGKAIWFAKRGWHTRTMTAVLPPQLR